jgi:uncharacterized membrane protein YccC
VGALGALNVSGSDSRDPYSIRARRMVSASVVVALAVFLGATAGNSSPAAVIVASLWSFAAGMLVVLGLKAGNLGVITIVTLVVFEARPMGLSEAAQAALVAFAGALLETVLAVAFWPVQPYGPQRRIIAALYETLSQVARATSAPALAPPAGRQITDAREALTTFAGDHTVESERYVSLLSLAERIRLSLLTLRRLRARLARDERGQAAADAVGRVLTAAADALESVAKRVNDIKFPLTVDAFSAMAREFDESAPQSDSGLLGAAIRDARQQTDSLAGQIRNAAHMALGSVTIDATTARSMSWRLRFSGRLARLRANLSLDSTAFRHAIRLAVCVGIGDAIARSIMAERAYWIPMTIAIILKPDFTSTFSRGVLRLGGTLAGLLVATALFHFIHTGVATDIALLALFTFLLRWIGPANYGIFVTAVSGLVVLLIALTGVEPYSAITARALNTAFGGALALLAYWLWPTWERTHAGAVLAEMLDAYRDYFHALIDALYGRAVLAPELDRLRDNGRRARSNAEASVDRVASEPGATAEQAGLLTAILAGSHGFAHAAMAMESALDQTAPAPPRPAAVEFARVVESTLCALAGMLRGDPLSQEIPDLRAAHNAILKSGEASNERYTLINTETDRIVTSLNTTREQIGKWKRSLAAR